MIQTPEFERTQTNFLLSNCSWKNEELEVTYRQPFDMIVEMHREHEMKKAAHFPKSDLFENWLPEAARAGHWEVSVQV